jgi:hypothetical protein
MTMTEDNDQPVNEDRRRKAVTLAMAGLDWQRIAEQCEYPSRQDAIEDVSAALTDNPVDVLSPEVTKKLMIARMSRMLAGVWTGATAGNNRSVEVATRLIKELCTLQGVADTPAIPVPEAEAELSAYDELAARRPGTQSGPRRQRGRRRQAGPTA